GDSTNQIALVTSGTNARYFIRANVNSPYAEAFYGQETLVQDSANSQFLVFDSTARSLTFNDFTVTPASKRGLLKSLVDRNGTSHSLSYDVLGRQVRDAITMLGAGVDGQVRRRATAYDTGGRPYLFTSYDAATGGNVVNQVQRTFNGLGQLTAESQVHGDPGNPNAPRGTAQYVYSE